MSLDYSAHTFELVDEKALEKLCPKTYAEFDRLRTIIEDSQMHCFHEFVSWVAFKEDSFDKHTPIDGIEPMDFFNKLKAAYEALQLDAKVQIGVNIALSYHDSEHGGEYDDVNGYYFYATNCVGVTVVGQACRDIGLSRPASYVNAC